MLRELKLDIHADKKVTSLSGGQRKRVSVALELLTKPSLIFLDEPTSGLDPGMDRDVMQLLRGLADDGRTVLVVTHSVAELALCDKLLVMAPGGSVAYFGPPEEALNFFGYDTWADVFSAFENYRDYDWAGRWQRLAALPDVRRGHRRRRPAVRQVPPPQPVAAAQAAELGRRSCGRWSAAIVSVIASDKGFMALMVILPGRPRRGQRASSRRSRPRRPPDEPGRFNQRRRHDHADPRGRRVLLGRGQLRARADQGTGDLRAGTRHRPVPLRVPDVQGHRARPDHRPAGRHHLRHRLRAARAARRGPDHAGCPAVEIVPGRSSRSASPR